MNPDLFARLAAHRERRRAQAEAAIGDVAIAFDAPAVHAPLGTRQGVVDALEHVAVSHLMAAHPACRKRAGRAVPFGTRWCEVDGWTLKGLDELTCHPFPSR